MPGPGAGLLSKTSALVKSLLNSFADELSVLKLTQLLLLRCMSIIRFLIISLS